MMVNNAHFVQLTPLTSVCVAFNTFEYITEIIKMYIEKFVPGNISLQIYSILYLDTFFYHCSALQFQSFPILV